MKDPKKVEAGRKGGLRTSAKKAAAVQRNGLMPCRPGKHRGGYRRRTQEPQDTLHDSAAVIA